jgi:hypothetical protein
MKDEILSMHLQRDTWRKVQEIVEENGQLPDSYWWEFMRDTYGITQAVAVRRQADTHRDVTSLGKLVSEIADDPKRITREFWLDLWNPDEGPDELFARNAWAKQWGGEVGDHLDPAIPAADVQALDAASAKVTRYVNKHLAHSDRNPVPASELPTLLEVHEAIDTIGHLYKKYYNLLTAASWVFLVPAMQHDWKAVFREPWIRPG